MSVTQMAKAGLDRDMAAIGWGDIGPTMWGKSHRAWTSVYVGPDTYVRNMDPIVIKTHCNLTVRGGFGSATFGSGR